MKYLVTASHGTGGGRFVERGDVIELDEKTAAERIRWGFIKPYVEKEERSKATAEGKLTGHKESKTQG